MNCNDVEARIGSAITNMALAQRRLLDLADENYPRMFTNEDRVRWKVALGRAHENLRAASYDLQRMVNDPLLETK